ncbi:MAG: hypothetical protein AAF489_11480 [Bacteroidota bacterium]
MRLITLCTAIAVWAIALTECYAQDETALERIEFLEQTKEKIINEEKDALKIQVETINRKLEDGDITEEEANEMKQEAAEQRALNIENKLAIVDHRIDLVRRNGVAIGDQLLIVGLGTNTVTGGSIFGINFTNSSDHKRKYDRRTKSELIFSFGLNNVIGSGQSLDDSPFKVGGSRYAEIGLGWKTRVFKESNWLRFKYGISFQFNGLKPEDNQYFVDTGDQTELQEFPEDLKKSKFRMDNMVIPVHFEFGPSSKLEREDYFRYSTYNKFRVGLGGYAGLNLGARQKLKFKSEGEDVKQKLKANYNTNNFIYGLSGYIGFSQISVYVKYDLNTIFKDDPLEQRNVSLGLRWDWD